MFVKATKKKRPVRLELQGLSNSGKTYTALALAQTFAGAEGKIAVVDTEHGRAELYSHLFNFDIVKLSDFSPASYIRAIQEAEKAGYRVMIIDSLSHAWIGKGGVLEIAGGVFGGWKKATPEHNKLVEAILSSPLHIITTCRMKQGYSVDKDATGKQTVTKLGLEVIQRDGIEYEFDWVLELDLQHNAKVVKAPIPTLNGVTIPSPGEGLAQNILAFLNDGEEEEKQPAAAANAQTAPQRRPQ